MCIARDYTQTDKHLFCYFYIPSQKCSFKSLQKPDLLPLPGDTKWKLQDSYKFIYYILMWQTSRAEWSSSSEILS